MKEELIHQEHDMDVDEDNIDNPDDNEEVDWDKQLERALQFSLKRWEVGTRKSNRNRVRKLESLSLESIKERLLEIEEAYCESAKHLNKTWAPFKITEELKSQIKIAQDELTIRKILLVLEEGFSNPMSYKSWEGVQTNSVEAEDDNLNESEVDFRRTNKIIQDGMIFSRNNRKIKKFWSSDTLRDCWKDHVDGNDSDDEEEKGNTSNENAEDKDIEVSPMLFLWVCIFIDQTETYIEKLNAKAEKKRQIDEVSGKELSKKSSKQQEVVDRKRKAVFYKEESSEELSEESKPKNKRRKLSADSIFEDEESIDDDESVEMEDYDDDEEFDDDSNWDSNWYVCNKKGNVVWCDGCTKVAHLKCLKLRVVPENEWYWEDCRYKMQNKRQTRSSRKYK